MINKLRSNRNKGYPADNVKVYKQDKIHTQLNHNRNLSEVLVVTTYPPRECGIATYSHDLILVLNNKFENTFDIKVAALETRIDNYSYGDEVTYVLQTDNQRSYIKLAESINSNRAVELVLIQHEFGLFKTNETDFLLFLKAVNKP